MFNLSRNLSYALLFLVMWPDQLLAAERPILQIDTGGHTSLIRNVLFTRDGRYLVSAGDDKTIRVWDWRKGHTVKIIRGQIAQGPVGLVYAMALSPDGRLLASAGRFSSADGTDKGAIRIYDFATGQILALLKGHTMSVFSLAFSPDGKYLASGSADLTARIWDVKNGQEVRVFREHSNYIYSVAFSKDGKSFLTGAYDKTVRIWSIDDKKPGKVLARHDGRVRSIAVSPRSGVIASGGTGPFIRLTDPQTGEEIRRIHLQGRSVAGLSFDPQGRFLVSGTTGQKNNFAVVVYDVESGKKLTTYRGHDNIVLVTAVSPDGRWIASAGGVNNEIHIWDRKTVRQRQILKGRGNTIWSVGISQSGSSIAWGNRPIGRINAIGELTHSLRLGGDGNGIGEPRELTGSSPLFTRRKTRNKQYYLMHSKIQENRPYSQLNIYRDGEQIASISRDAMNGTRHTSYGFINNGKTVISGGMNGVLRSYNLASSELRQFKGHAGEVFALAASLDKDLIVVSGSQDQTVRLWNGKTGELIVSLFQSIDKEWVIWTLQGYYISSAGGDNMIGWHINQGPDKKARYVTARQLKRHLWSQEVVEKAIALGSAEKAIREVRPNDIELTKLLQHRPPEFQVKNVENKPNEIELILEQEVSRQEKVRVVVNGRSVVANDLRGFMPIKTKENVLPLSIPLAKGNNSITVTISNEWGETSRKISLKSNKRGVLDRSGTLHVLAIGIDKYSNLPGNDLRFAGVDASEFLKWITKNSDDLFSKINPPQLLTSQTSTKPTASNILKALKFASDAAKNDTVVLFIAGHGVNVSGDYLLLTEDSRMIGGKWDRASVVSWKVIEETFKNSKGRRILFIDTCHSGGAYNHRIRKDTADAGILAFSATDADTLAEEREQLSHGVFTYALGEGLSGRADYNSDGKVGIYELNSFVSNKVIEITNGAQRPAINAQNFVDFTISTP